MTGGSGFLGRRIVRRAREVGVDVVAPAHGVLDVRDVGAVLSALETARPAVVAHLASRMDERDTIVAGSGNVARAAAAIGARLVHLSTDVVFTGRPAPFTERDRLEPLSEYGRAKADAEAMVGLEHDGAVLVRTSLLYSSDRDDAGPQAALVRDALADPSAVTFFEDEVRCPALAEDVAAAVLALALGDGEAAVHRGPLHVAGAQGITRADFARALATWLGGDPSVLRTGSQAATGRPGNVVLDCSAAEALGLRCRGVDDALGSAGSA